MSEDQVSKELAGSNPVTADTSGPVDIDSLPVSLLIVASQENAFKQLVNYLEKRDWQVRLVTGLNDAVQAVVSIKPNFVLISYNHPNPKVEKLPNILAQSFNCTCVAFGEKTDRMTQARVQASPLRYKIPGQISGPTVQRRIKQILQEMYGLNDEAKEREKKTANASGSDLIRLKTKDGLSGDDSVQLEGSRSGKDSVHIQRGRESKGEMVAKTQGGASQKFSQSASSQNMNLTDPADQEAWAQQMLAALEAESADSNDSAEGGTTTEFGSSEKWAAHNENLGEGMDEHAREDNSIDDQEAADAGSRTQRESSSGHEDYGDRRDIDHLAGITGKKQTFIEAAETARRSVLTNRFSESAFATPEMAEQWLEWLKLSLEDYAAQVADREFADPNLSRAAIWNLTNQKLGWQGALIVSLPAELEASIEAELKTLLIEKGKQAGVVIELDNPWMIDFDYIDLKPLFEKKADLLIEYKLSEQLYALSLIAMAFTDPQLLTSDRPGYLRIRPEDLPADVKLDFEVSVFLELNNKHVNLAKSGRSISFKQKQRIIDQNAPLYINEADQISFYSCHKQAALKLWLHSDSAS